MVYGKNTPPGRSQGGGRVYPNHPPLFVEFFKNFYEEIIKAAFSKTENMTKKKAYLDETVNIHTFYYFIMGAKGK